MLLRIASLRGRPPFARKRSVFLPELFPIRAKIIRNIDQIRLCFDIILLRTTRISFRSNYVHISGDIFLKRQPLSDGKRKSPGFRQILVLPFLIFGHDRCLAHWIADVR